MPRHFEHFRNNIVGGDATLSTPYGEKPLVYADWIASGRLYRPIEQIMLERFGPLVGNTHSESSDTGLIMTRAYQTSHRIIKDHVNAGEKDVIITAGFGMTAVVNKLQRILGLKGGDRGVAVDLTHGIPSKRPGSDSNRPIVFVTHMEHHSNHTSWLETDADVVVLEPDENLAVNPESLERELRRHADRTLKFGAFSAGSNVTGIVPPYRELARIMHRHGGYAFVDFAASAPYINIDMHPSNDPDGYLDAVYFSPHKFLGGPGSSGVLVFNSELYRRDVPDHPGGGTVTWTNRWGIRSYITDIEAREDGGTPGFLQSIRAALAIELKEEMGADSMAERERCLIGRSFEFLSRVEGLHILGGTEGDRIGVVSFYLDTIHHNLAVRLLNDRYGIQVRGGCSCAGTYGHFLLQLSRDTSRRIKKRIDEGDLSLKPGWVRLSLHPTMPDAELEYVLNAIREITLHPEWGDDYDYNPHTNEYHHQKAVLRSDGHYRRWFALGNS